VNEWLYAVVVLVVVTLLATYAVWTAGRIDRLHHRVAAARSALDAQLAARAALVQELAGSGALDPASSLLLVDAAHRARTALPEDREGAESALTRALEATVGDLGPDQLGPAAEPVSPGGELELWRAELVTATRRIQLARRFHNDVVVSTRNLRRRRLVRWLHLAGRAPIPETVELDGGS
jgi:hypothetical protein